MNGELQYNMEMLCRTVDVLSNFSLWENTFSIGPMVACFGILSQNFCGMIYTKICIGVCTELIYLWYFQWHSQ